MLFAIPRTAGWLAHWVELLEQDQKIARPRQLYVGDYVPIASPPFSWRGLLGYGLSFPPLMGGGFGVCANGADGFRALIDAARP